MLIYLTDQTDPSNINDIFTDFVEVAGNLLINGRFAEAQRKNEVVKEVYPNSKITAIGHSLGGSEAVYVARNNNNDAVAYNIGSSPLPIPSELEV